MNEVDLGRFEFDFDTTWNAFFLDAELNVYSRYGGRDEGEPEDRLSKSSLLQTMREVLDLHARRRQRKPDDPPLMQPVPTEAFRPADIPLLAAGHRGCLHCHQVREYQLLQAFHDGVFTRRELFGWPLPENLGLRIDRRHGHRIESLQAGSAAAETALRPGDEIVQVGDVPVRSEYDIRWALHRADDDAPLWLDVRRPGDPPRTIGVTVQPRAGWRVSDLSWRKSMRSVPMDFGFRGYSLTRSQRRTERLRENELGIRVVSARDHGLAGNLGLKQRDVITALEDQTALRTMEQFKSDILCRYRPGEEVRMTVRREGKTLTLTGPLPEWKTEETTVP